MSKDPLFDEVVSKIVQTIFMGFQYTDTTNGYVQTNTVEAPIKGVIDKILDKLDFEELRARVQKELEDKYMNEVVEKVVGKLRDNIYEKEGYSSDNKVKFADFVSKGLESAITKYLNESQEFKDTLSESINLDDVEIKVNIAKKERV